jgi:hypothetical protein
MVRCRRWLALDSTDDRLLAVAVAQRLTDEEFVVAGGVAVARVEQGHAGIERGVDRGHRLRRVRQARRSRTCLCSAGMSERRRTTLEEARQVGDAIGVDWNRFDLEQFRAGMDVELEHGSHDPQTDVTHDDPILTGKIALAHMKGYPDCYERLERMETEAERDRATKQS